MGELWMSLVWMRKGWRGGREQRSDKLWRCSSKQFVSLLLSVIVSFPRCRFIIIRCCSAIHSFLTRWENWLWPSESRQPKSLIPIFCPQPPTKPCIKVQSKIFTLVYNWNFFPFKSSKKNVRPQSLEKGWYQQLQRQRQIALKDTSHVRFSKSGEFKDMKYDTYSDHQNR